MDSRVAWDEIPGLCALSDEDFDAQEDRAAELVHVLNGQGDEHEYAFAQLACRRPAPTDQPAVVQLINSTNIGIECVVAPCEAWP